MPNAEESKYIQELREELMEMELDELKMDVLAEIKEEQPDVELPSGGKEEIVAWAIEWEKASEVRRKPDEDALRAIRAASTALQALWPEGESPRSWKGVKWSDDRVQQLYLMDSGLEVLAPQIGQLTAVTKLILSGCRQLKELPPQIGQLTALTKLELTNCDLQLKELPPQIGQLTALINLDLYGCEQLKELPPQIGQLTALTNLNLRYCNRLKELPPQVGQLTALTNLNLRYCNRLKELPPQIGQLTALAYLDLGNCDQLTLAPGAEDEQPAPTIVAAYAPLLIVAPRKDAPGELHAFLLANPLAVPAFYKTILTDAAYATWLGEAVTATPELAKLTDDLGRRAIDAAHSVCKQAMQAALFLLGRFDVDDGKLLHRSATAAVAAADDHHGDPEAKPVPRVALKAMREVEQVRAELAGRAGLDPKYVIAIKAVYADEEAVDAGAWGSLERAAAGLEGVELQRVPGLSRSIQAHLFPSKQVKDQASDTAAPDAGRELKRGLTARTLDASSEYKLLIVLELADRNLKHTIDHEHIAGKDWPAIRYVASHLGRALEHVHDAGGIHADLKPLNAVGDGNTWKIIDFDVFCKVGEPFGNKIPSSGYCPPEMAKVLLAATDQDTGKVDTSLLKEYVASEAYDLWSFGVVLYHLCFATPLWKTDINDNVDLEGLRLLASVSDPRLRKALDKALNDGVKSSASDQLKVATALLRKLLEPDPSKRLEYFERFHTPMEGVLDEPFFLGKSLDGATLEQIQQQNREILALQAKQVALLLENKFELLHTRKVLLKGIFEATEVLMPTTFIILDEVLSAEEPELSAEEQDQLLSLKEDGSGIELAGNLKVAKERLDKAKTWLDRLKTFGEGVIENNPNKVFGKIKEIFAELITKKTMYFYLVDELTGLPVRGDGYPIKITKPSELVPKLLPVMQVGMRAMSLYNGVAGVAQMVGYPAPKVPEGWRKGAQSSVEVLKQESSVEKFGAVHAKVQEGDNEQQTTRGASLRELQRFFEEHDKDKGYAGLRRIADEDGTAVWTLLKETELAAQLEKRARERREEERRHEKIFSDHEAARAELKTAQGVVEVNAVRSGGTCCSML